MKFLMDIIMPPLRASSKSTHNRNNNYFVPHPTTTNEDNKFNCNSYPTKVLNNLNSLRVNSRFCDVQIIAEDKIFKVTCKQYNRHFSEKITCLFVVGS